VNPWAQIMNTNILIPNFYIGKGVVLNTLWDITENNLWEIQKKLWGSYQVNENSIILKEKKENKVTPITQTSWEEDKDKNKKENLKNPFDIPTNMQIINNWVNQLLQRIGENLQERAKQTWEIINTTLESIYNLLWKK
jgi:hypothetical protein